jgi:hypothetical protein
MYSGKIAVPPGGGGIRSLHRVVYVANSTAHNNVTNIYNKAVVYNFDFSGYLVQKYIFKLIFLIKSFSLKW